MDLSQKQIKGLKKLAHTLPAFFILRYFRTLKRSRGYHNVEYLLQIAGNGALEFKREDLVPAYSEVLDVVKEFDRLKLGTYIIGRKKHKTRIEWNDDVSLFELGLAAISEPDDVVAELDLLLGADELSGPVDGTHLRPSGNGHASGTSKSGIDHSYQLRAGLFVDFCVPENLTQLEAQRLAAFVGTLSMES
jgi:hypothetical protein